jgi:hypothetical protein
MACRKKRVSGPSAIRRFGHGSEIDTAKSVKYCPAQGSVNFQISSMFA